MKKIIGSTLALALFLPALANAELFKNLKVGGQLDVQATSARNVTDFVTRMTPPAPAASPSVNNNDRIGHTSTRLMVKLDWDLLDDVHSRLTLVKGAGAGNARVYGAGSDNITAVEATTFVEEAFAKVDKLFGFADMTMGRQFIGAPGDMIVWLGPKDNYGLTVTALDAFRFDWSGEFAAVMGYAGRVVDANLAANANGSASTVDAHGLLLMLNKNENVKGTAYLHHVVTHMTGGLGIDNANPAGAIGGKNSHLYVAGLKSNLTFGGFMAAIEFAKNFGQDRTTFANAAGGARSVSYTGHAYKLNLGYKAEVQDVGVFNPWGEYALATGDNNFDFAGNRNFQAVSSDYRPGAIYGRFDNNAAVTLGANVTGFQGAENGFSNRRIWGVGFKATPAGLNKLTTGLQFYRYAFDRLPTNANGQRFSRNIGSEVDVTGEWKHSENVGLKATVGSFKPGAYVADVKGPGAALNPVFMTALDVSIKF